MVLIPAGEFMMGNDDVPEIAPGLETPAHKVTMDKPYYIDVYEVTNGQWIKFLTESRTKVESNWRPMYSIGKEDFPVSNLTLDDAKAYCEWAGGRLPTEAEWERAARGPENFSFPWGNVYDPSKSNTNDMNFNGLVEVGSFETDKSGYGVYDMMGNVQEWTNDRLRPYPKSKARNNPAFTGRFRLYALRGSSFAFKGSSMNLMTRSGYPAKAQYGTGFRCAKDAEEEAPAEGGGEQ
jgi:formylglycine-generating enzyme required for sulfatase activity